MGDQSDRGQMGQYALMFGGPKRAGRPSAAGSEVYERLRRAALDAVANGLALPSAEHPDISGVVIDIPAQSGFATVVALTDNTTSMYTSNGGGTIGAGEHDTVARATHDLLSVVQANLGLFGKPDAGGFPGVGFVRFHVLTPSARRYADTPEDAFWGRAPDALMGVIVAAQNTISAIREASPQ